MCECAAAGVAAGMLLQECCIPSNCVRASRLASRTAPCAAWRTHWCRTPAHLRAAVAHDSAGLLADHHASGSAQHALISLVQGDAQLILHQLWGSHGECGGGGQKGERGGVEELWTAGVHASSKTAIKHTVHSHTFLRCPVASLRARLREARSHTCMLKHPLPNVPARCCCLPSGLLHSHTRCLHLPQP